MGQALNVAKKRIVEYASCGWFYGYEGQEHFHHVLDALNIGYTSETDCPEFEKEFEVERKALEIGIEKLRAIERGEEVDDVDVDSLTVSLDNASTTFSECIDCFEWLLNKSDKENEKEWIYVSFF